MATDRIVTDSLKQVGKKIGKFQKESDNTIRYQSKNLPLIEQSTDFLGPLYPYALEFKVYRGQSVFLNIRVLEKFRVQ